jgi:hypothetical protein
MHLAHKAFEVFDHPDRNLTRLVELRIFLRWSVLNAMVAWHRVLTLLTRHSKTFIRPSCKGTESFWILGFLTNQAGVSVCWSRGTWPDSWTCEVMRCWGFECWTSHASLPICFQLSVQTVRCYSHLARPCEIFHNWGDKTWGTLIDRNHDARPESGDTIGVMMPTGVGKCDRSWDIWPESYLPIRVGHTTEVTYTTRVVIYLHYKHV